MAFREPKKNIARAKDPHAYGVSKKINKREKQAQSYFNNISSRSLSGPAAFVHPADNVPWSKKRGRKSGKKTESLSALGKKTPARKIVNEKANSQIGFIFGAIVVIIIIVIILLAIFLG